MWLLNPQVRVYLCTAPVDLRKSFDGLSGLVQTVFEQPLLDGHLFLFVNRRRDRLKMLWWERDGLAIGYKRLERGTFELPRAPAGQQHIQLDAAELAMLLGGISLRSARRRPRYRAAS